MESYEAAEKLNELVYWLRHEVVEDWYVEIEDYEYEVDLGQFGNQTLYVTVSTEISIDPQEVLAQGPVGTNDLEQIAALVEQMGGEGRTLNSGNDLLLVCEPYDTLYGVVARRNHDDKDELHGPFMTAQAASERVSQLRNGNYSIVKVVSIETNVVEAVAT